MGIFSGMNDKSAPRAFSWIWYIRIAQIFFTGIVIILAGVDANRWSSCSVPGKIAWNLACVREPMVMVLSHASNIVIFRLP